MPWNVSKSDRCPAAKPWAVVKKTDNSLEGCHATKQKALAHAAKLYSLEDQMSSLSPEADLQVRDSREFAFDHIEWRKSDHSEDFTFTGTAVVFNHWSEPLGPGGAFRERILPGAFGSALERNPDVRLLFNHDENFVLARTKSGTLELSEEEDGLRVWARVAPTSYARDLRMAMERGDIDQMSFAFGMDAGRGAEDRWYEDEASGELRRDVAAVSDLYDVSAVTSPAYLDTSAAMRSMAEAVERGVIHLRAVIPFRETPKADMGAAWNGPAEVARADVEDLRAMCAWYDANNPDVKTSYKLPHHAADASHPVIWRGVTAAMQRLTSTDIPQSDMEGCHGHLSKHYAQFDKDAPEMGDMMRALELATNDARMFTDEDFEDRAALQAALERVSTEPAEIDPAVDQQPEGEAAEIDPPLEGSDALAQLRALSRETAQREREAYLRLLKEMTT